MRRREFLAGRGRKDFPPASRPVTADTHSADIGTDALRKDTLRAHRERAVRRVPNVAVAVPRMRDEEFGAWKKPKFIDRAVVRRDLAHEAIIAVPHPNVSRARRGNPWAVQRHRVDGSAIVERGDALRRVPSPKGDAVGF